MNPAVSVVIPTLGGPSLERTIEALNRGSLVPAEILVCLPAGRAAMRALPWPNVRVVDTGTRGQVAQRAAGFGQAASPLVMQLDDDLIVAPDCVERLRQSLLGLGPKAAVSPSLVDAATGASVYRKPRRPAIVDRIYYFLLNGSRGYEAGRILKSGAAIGLDATTANGDVREVEWVPGGCVMHRRENLVLDAFYPFPGKAYCEDIIHSHHLKSRGIRLFVEPGAVVAIDEPAVTPGIRAFVKEMSDDLRARRHFMQLSSRSTLQLSRFVVARWVSYLAERRRARPEDRA